MQLPHDIELEFREQLEQLELENRMPYITSIERLVIEKGRAEGRDEGRQEGREAGREEGMLVGKIQLLQRILGETIESDERLLGLTLEVLAEKLRELQQRFDER